MLNNKTRNFTLMCRKQTLLYSILFSARAIKFLGASTLDIVVDNSHVVFAVLFIAAFKPPPFTNYDSIHLKWFSDEKMSCNFFT